MDDFKIPVAVASGRISKGAINGGGHIGSGDLTQPVDHPLSCW